MFAANREHSSMAPKKKAAGGENAEAQTAPDHAEVAEVPARMANLYDQNSLRHQLDQTVVEVRCAAMRALLYRLMLVRVSLAYHVRSDVQCRTEVCHCRRHSRMLVILKIRSVAMSRLG
jgi:hypothetical protein